jgi:predicted metal-dependent phosphoesterase TrpH
MGRIIGYYQPVSEISSGPLHASALRRCDLHVHTRHSCWRSGRILRARDSHADPIEVYDRARRAGMDFVAITDHESIDGCLALLDARPELEPEVIVGEEVETRFPDTGQWVHVNVFGLDEASHREVQRLRPSVYDLVGYLRRRRFLHVLNHPFLSYRFQKRPRAYVEEILDLFDHFEAGNSTMSPGHTEAAEAMLAYARAVGLRKTAVAGSDAHQPDDIATSFTLAPGVTAAEWLASVARGECFISTAPIGFPRLLGNVYRAVGSYYLDLARGPGRAGMTPGNYLAAATFLPAATVLGLPAILTCLNEARQRSVLALTRRTLARMAASESPAPAEALD